MVWNQVTPCAPIVRNPPQTAVQLLANVRDLGFLTTLRRGHTLRQAIPVDFPFSFFPQPRQERHARPTQAHRNASLHAMVLGGELGLYDSDPRLLELEPDGFGRWFFEQRFAGHSTCHHDPTGIGNGSCGANGNIHCGGKRYGSADVPMVWQRHFHFGRQHHELHHARDDRTE
jgi:hypothetical protein